MNEPLSPQGRSRRTLLTAGAAAAAAGLGLFAALQLRGGSDQEALEALWRLPLQDLTGQPLSLEQWRGRPLIVNFWATWCEPCREEMPLLVKAHQQYASKNLQIVGIALDSVAKVQQFAKELNIPYPLALGSLGAIDITRKFGNTAAGLPYTLAIAANGRVATRHLGGMTSAQLEAAIGTTMK